MGCFVDFLNKFSTDAREHPSPTNQGEPLVYQDRTTRDPPHYSKGEGQPPPYPLESILLPMSEHQRRTWWASSAPREDLIARLMTEFGHFPDDGDERRLMTMQEASVKADARFENGLQWLANQGARNVSQEPFEDDTPTLKEQNWQRRLPGPDEAWPHWRPSATRRGLIEGRMLYSQSQDEAENEANAERFLETFDQIRANGTILRPDQATRPDREDPGGALVDMLRKWVPNHRVSIEEQTEVELECRYLEEEMRRDGKMMPE